MPRSNYTNHMPDGSKEPPIVERQRLEDDVFMKIGVELLESDRLRAAAKDAPVEDHSP